MASCGNTLVAGLCHCCLCSHNGKWVRCVCGKHCFSCVQLKRGHCSNCDGANEDSDRSVAPETSQHLGSVDFPQSDLETTQASSSQV